MGDVGVGGVSQVGWSGVCHAGVGWVMGVRWVM